MWRKDYVRLPALVLLIQVIACLSSFLTDMVGPQIVPRVVALACFSAVRTYFMRSAMLQGKCKSGPAVITANGGDLPPSARLNSAGGLGISYIFRMYLSYTSLLQDSGFP